MYIDHWLSFETKMGMREVQHELCRRDGLCWCGSRTHRGGQHVVFCWRCKSLHDSTQEFPAQCPRCAGPLEISLLGDAIMVMEGYFLSGQSGGGAVRFSWKMNKNE